MAQRHDNEQRPPLPGAGVLENYTLPFLWTAGLLVFVALFAVWARHGLPGALICAALADVAMRRWRR